MHNTAGRLQENPAARAAARAAHPLHVGRPSIRARQREPPVPTVHLDFARTRIVSRDYTVAYETKRLQLDLAAARAARPGTAVVVHEHVDGTISLWRGKRELGRYSCIGKALRTEDNKKNTRRAAA